jgi:hypothetical protein
VIEVALQEREFAQFGIAVYIFLTTEVKIYLDEVKK